MLTERVEFVPENDREIFAGVPAAAGVFLLRGEDAAAEPYVTKTANLRRRLERLLGAPEERSRRLNLRGRVRWIEYARTGSDFESGFLLYRLLREHFPKTYADRMRFRFAPLVKFHLENEYPRASVTTRLGRLTSGEKPGATLYYGPFSGRTAAEKFLNDSLDFFKVRRCVEDLHPDPAFPGCIYSEMKMCLAPCFKGCTEEEYSGEVERVRGYLDSRGQSLVREISSAREEAAQNLAFEEAAAIHAKLEKLKPLLGQLPEVVGRIDRLVALIVQPAASASHAEEVDSVALFLLQGGVIRGPQNFLIQALEHAKSQSMEARVEACIAAAPPPDTVSAAETMEHLAILKRWYYRSNRVGEIFLADDKGLLPMRRVVRGIGRVWRGEKAEPGVVVSAFPS